MRSASFRFSIVTALLATLVACETRPRETSLAASASSTLAPAAPASSAAASSSKGFGAPISPGPELALSEVLSHPEQFRDRAVTVEGQVRAACTRRGCWMELAQSSDPKLPGCRVTFKDYGFFVPTDSAGSHAKVQGTLGVNTLPAERVAHLESEGGQFPRKNADGSVDELRLVATGVELRRD
ncbi:MAG TPA: DUF4920 domain-containing protein [Polyangiaceae bacterium]|nr:DUF4920 domain-containing protein [Polyangiaceae bacterium]